MRPGHEINVARLKGWAQREILGSGKQMEIQQFEVGQSNPAYLLDTDETQYVLRKQPPGELLPLAHRVDREYLMQKILAFANVPIPKMIKLLKPHWLPLILQRAKIVKQVGLGVSDRSLITENLAWFPENGH